MSTINTPPQPATASPFKWLIWANSTRTLKITGVLALGLLSFASLLALTFEGPFFRWNGIFGLGLGGIERMVVYPIIIWEIALGAFLMSGAISSSHGEKE